MFVLSFQRVTITQVLQVDPDTPLVDVKKKFRQLSLLVHPDKNRDDSERAQKAFDAVTKAYRTLEDPEASRKCKEVVDEAKERVEQMMIEKRRNLRRRGSFADIEEDDPEKLFADLERLRVEEELKQSNERKRKAQEEEEEKRLVALEKEYRKNYEVCLDFGPTVLCGIVNYVSVSWTL
ncbi:DNaJ domain (Prokaryotic heat shock protein) [Fasciola hepatica]|uniref:DNaJ domain (Prokaryotic heat shock protein) n=1 Tax=Fasciola hepatica TaxID=6192 RepID=A0A4E0QTU5_FASHE|nr:DNaJ domain (Prokaryotic heat shock protein) [Fasciola hepatica]